MARQVPAAAAEATAAAADDLDDCPQAACQVSHPLQPLLCSRERWQRKLKPSAVCRKSGCWN